MGRRTLQASTQGIAILRKAIKRKKGGQTYLAGAVGCARQTIWSLLQGNSTDCDVFMAVCKELALNWEDIAQPETSEPEADLTLDSLVQTVRQKIYANIQKRCGTMRVLDMEQPISLDSIYTKVNILEKVSRNQRRTIAELLEGCDREDFDRLTLRRVQQERIPGVDAVQRHDKLLILGKPGAGKTTFLKWLAIQCNEGQLHSDRVPIFITLKEFAEDPRQPGLQKFIGSQFRSCGIDDGESVTEKLLQEGRSLVLLDGLDEVRDVDHDRILQEICNISTQFDASQFIITCRIAAREYTFQQFTEVEVADFDDEQIMEFSHKWFHEKDAVKAEQFPEELKAYEPLKELATNPLLLTLLCLVFEEQAGFPVNRAELYKEGLDILLKKWDAKRNIKRDEIYKELSLKRKEDLLSQIAFTTFERSEYFFKQKTVEHEIEKYIRNLPNTNTDPTALQTDSEAVLKSIEAQHGLMVERARGIYSFSHLTFHEYFTARELETRDGMHSTLMAHLTEKRWQEVFLLTAGMLKNADSLLLTMKSQIDEMLTTDENLQQFLTWVQQKAGSVNVPYKPAALRAFYVSHSLCLRDLDHTLSISLPFTHSLSIDRSFSIDYSLFIDRFLSDALYISLFRVRDLEMFTIRQSLLRALFKRALSFSLPPELTQFLQKLWRQLPESGFCEKYIEQWWQTKGGPWTAQLRALMVKQRNIGHDWQFSDAQRKLLQQYYDANKLLADCLNSDCYVSRQVREEIEVSLLLPISEIEQTFPNQRRSP